MDYFDRKQARRDGERAFDRGEGSFRNPHDRFDETERHRAWDNGYDDARRESERREEEEEREELRERQESARRAQQQEEEMTLYEQEMQARKEEEMEIGRFAEEEEGPPEVPPNE